MYRFWSSTRVALAGVADLALYALVKPLWRSRLRCCGRCVVANRLENHVAKILCLAGPHAVHAPQVLDGCVA